MTYPNVARHDVQDCRWNETKPWTGRAPWRCGGSHCHCRALRCGTASVGSGGLPGKASHLQCGLPAAHIGQNAKVIKASASWGGGKTFETKGSNRMKPFLILCLAIAFAAPAIAGCPAYDPNCKPACPDPLECR
jgi:hypothetical protein